MSETGKVRGYRLVVTITFLNSMLVCWLLYCNYSSTEYVLKLKLEMIEMQADISLLKAKINKPLRVDFSSDYIQEIEGGFLIAGASQAVGLTGMVFSGKIINSKSVAMTNLLFGISVADESNTFAVDRIPPGGSADFSVYVADIKEVGARMATVNFISGRYSYSTQ